MGERTSSPIAPATFEQLQAQVKALGAAKDEAMTAQTALIATDLDRTFTSLGGLFGAVGSPYSAKLRIVLETFAVYRPDVGYVQGMS